MAGMPALFEPLRLGGIALANRIAVSPMCQYSAENGAPQYLRARPGTVTLRSADTVPTGAGTPLNSDPTQRDDGPQPVADLGSAANRIHDLARNPIAPNQVAAGRLCIQSAIIGGDRDDLGR